MLIARLRGWGCRAESRLILEIAQDPAAVSIRLSPALSEAAVAEMVRGRLGDDAESSFCAACHHATGGNPLLVGELLKTMRAEGVTPDAAHADAIRQIGPRAVGARSCCGSGGCRRMRSRLPARSRCSATARASGDGIARRGSMSAEAQTRRTHSLLRRSCGRSRRSALSTRSCATQFITSSRCPSGSSSTNAPPRLLPTLAPRRRSSRATSLRYRRVASAGWPMSWCRRGTRDAPWRSRECCSYLRRALDERPADQDRPRLLSDLGWVESHVSVPSASEHLREAYRLLEVPLQRGLVAEILAGILLMSGAADDAVEVAQTAIAELGERHQDQRRALESMELYGIAFGAHVADAPARLARRARRGRPGTESAQSCLPLSRRGAGRSAVAARGSARS